MKKAIDDELRSATFRSQDLVAMERIVAKEKRRLHNEIERLREDIAIRDQNLDHYVAMIKEQRAATIEECARVIEEYHRFGRIITIMAAAIRALKDKP